MKEITVRELLSLQTNADFLDFSLYVIKVPDPYNTVLYVGKSSRCVIMRMMEHLGLGGRWGGFPRYPDMLGQFIYERWPKSQEWKVQFYCRDEVLPNKVIEIMPGLDYTIRYDIDDSERELIKSLHPALNKVYNDEPSQIPDALFFSGKFDGSMPIYCELLGLVNA